MARLVDYPLLYLSKINMGLCGMAKDLLKGFT